MGNQCLASTPIQHYWLYFEDLKVSEIKDFWTTYQVFKLKKVYDQSATNHPQYPKHTHLPQANFMNIFSEIQEYPEKQKQRFFQIFNFDGHGFVDWNNFFSMVSICYFGPDQTIQTLIYLIFDQSLSKQISRPQLQLLITKNQQCILSQEQDNCQQMPIFTIQQILEQLLPKNKNTLTLKQWQQQCKKYFNISKFRKIFNVFNQQKLEKQLVHHYKEWNQLYIEKQQRFISYLINYKWFQCWKIYVKEQYGVTLNSENTTKKAMTFKTKKVIKPEKPKNGKKKIAQNLKLRELKWDDNQNTKIKKITNPNDSSSEEEVPEELKNYDFVHSNIGQKPQVIYNSVLEGEHQQILKHGLIQNRDYVLVSQKIWKYLKKIYDGVPQFCRTGFDFIELYPKILKVMNFSNGVINYSDNTIKQVSSYYSMDDVLEVIFNKQYVKTHQFYFKCLGMNKWEHIPDLQYALAELTSQIMVFVLAVNQKDINEFTKKYSKIPRDITEVNIGDYIKYHNPVRKIQETMVITGKNVEGKYILHIPGQSYLYDVCVLENDLFNKGKFLPSETLVLGNGIKLPPIQQFKMKKKVETGLVGIPNFKGLGFINSAIIHLYNDKAFREQLLSLKLPQKQQNQQQQQQNEDECSQIILIDILSKIFKQISQQKKVSPKLISNAIQQIMPDFSNFSAIMCREFISKFYEKLSAQLQKYGLKDQIGNYLMQNKKKIRCSRCQTVTQEEEKSYTINLPLATSQYKYYEITYVPYCQTLKTQNIKRYGFKLKSDATLKQYKQTFQKIVGIQFGTKYLLMQVYANKIVKNYSTAKNDATLAQLLLRDSDNIVAYQLQTDFSNFIENHYSQNVDYQIKQIRIDQFIDCKNSSRGWIFGKVCQTDYTPYGHRTTIRVIHKFSKGQQWQISYDVDCDTVANFPTKSYLNGEQYHLRLQQRYFNEASNDMQVCNMPLVVVLTNWMRWKQFYYMIYLQMKRFINRSQAQEGQQPNQNQNAMVLHSNKSISRKKTNKIRLDKFKDYLYGDNFPYKINFVDYSGRCAICFKFLKTTIFPQQEQSYCAGCKLSKSQPISWQIKISDVMVCIDWKQLTLFKKNLDIIKDHSSYANMSLQRKNDIDTIDNSFSLLHNGYQQMLDQLCCATECKVSIKQQITQTTQNIILYLQRVIQQDGYIKIINKHVKFNEEITMNGMKYQLVGLTSIDGGSNQSTKYRTFVKKCQERQEQEWVEYDGKIVRIVKKNIIEKVCALNLYYKKNSNVK